MILVLHHPALVGTPSACLASLCPCQRRYTPFDAPSRMEPLICGALFLAVQRLLYIQRMLTITSRLDVMNRLGRAMADPTRSRILLSLLDSPDYPAVLARDLGLTRTNVSNHLACDC